MKSRSAAMLRNATETASRIQHLEERLSAVTQEAAKNEAILRSSQAREMRLLEAASLDALLHELVYGLEESYRLEAVSVVLCDPCHEVRHLLLSDGRRSDDVFGVLFVDAAKDRLLDVDSFTRPRLEPYERARHGRLFPHISSLGSVALMPLLRQTKLVGSLNFGSADADRFTDRHATDFLHHLATIASFCLENAVNRARLVRSGLTDVLTGMHNRRYFQDRLAGELAGAQRHRLPLSCLLLDIDHFKRINDEHGHQTGDSVLRELARRISSRIRANDIGARFGGEEFVVLLPATDGDTAVKLGNRIRETVCRNPVAIGEDKAIAVSVSVGVSTTIPARNTDDLASLGDALVADADAALYRAKSAGRNCVRTVD